MYQRDDGKVALVYYQPVDKVIVIHDKKYFFQCKAGVPLCWVDEEDYPYMMKQKVHCGCARSEGKPMFRDPSIAQVEVWEGRYRR